MFFLLSETFVRHISSELSTTFITRLAIISFPELFDIARDQLSIARLKTQLALEESRCVVAEGTGDMLPTPYVRMGGPNDDYCHNFFIIFKTGRRICVSSVLRKKRELQLSVGWTRGTFAPRARVTAR